MLSSRFSAGFGAGSQQRLIFVRCNNYIGESCDDLLGATARNSVCRTSTCSQNFARVSARLFSILPAPERGSKMAAKIGVRKAKFFLSEAQFSLPFWQRGVQPWPSLFLALPCGLLGPTRRALLLLFAPSVAAVLAGFFPFRTFPPFL